LLIVASVSAVGAAENAGPGLMADRYAARDPASLTVPRRPVTRKDDVDCVRPFAKGFDVALASLVCDDAVAPVEPDGSSRLLARKEIIRLNDRQAKALFPDAGGIDGNMFMTPKVMPHKLVFRAGWKPGDMYMLVECYPRHDPLNPTAILGLERYSAAFAEMTSEKFVSRENAVQIQDLSGEATYLGQKTVRGEKTQLPTDWAGMESTVPAFSDHRSATHARVRVTGYMGFEATQERELLFVKNRFVLVRDETVFHDRFRARVGPAWNTQNVGEPRGAHWLNTWFSGHFFQTARLYDAPPWDLLIFHAPHADSQLETVGLGDTSQGPSRLVATRYAWEGQAEPGQRLQFVQVLLPHAPTRDATSLAAGIKVLADEPGLAAVSVTQGPEHEFALLNPHGRRVALEASPGNRFMTDAHAAYVLVRNGHAACALGIGATVVEHGGERWLQADARRDFEKTP
jgi:hypothetical protein